MIDLQRRVFFAHMPKTGGSSIEHAHGFKGSEPAPLRHTNERRFAEYLAEHPQHASEPFVRFTVVRNIFERLVSTYRHRDRALGIRAGDAGLSFEAYVEQIHAYFHGGEFHRAGAHQAYHYANEQAFLDGEAFLFDHRHIEPIEWWTRPSGDDYLYLRFEALDEDYARMVGPVTGIKRLPHANKTPRRFRRDVTFTPRARKLIAETYGEEIERFGMACPD